MNTLPILSPNFTSFSQFNSLNKSLFANYPPLLTTTTTTTTNPKRFTTGNSSISFPSVSSGTTTTTTIQSSLDIDSLSEKFNGRRGVSFSSLSDSCVVMTLSLKNKSVVKLMLPSGLITSYKAMMWHGGTVELLHTAVTDGKDGGEEALVNGGLSFDFLSFDDIQGNSFSLPSSANSWVLHQVTGDGKRSIQVQLIHKHEDKMEVEQIITLEEAQLSSEIVIRNLSESSSLRFLGSIMTHLTVSTPEATFASGLDRSEYCNTPPVLTDHSLIHPSLWNKNQKSRSNLNPISLSQLVSNSNTTYQEHTMKLELGDEDDDDDDGYKNLAQEMSRIYTTASRSITVMDKGKRNSMIIGRDGFDELYVFSPGSSHEWYGRYAYLCVGQAALLQPITLEPKAEWRGGQQLVNPNL